MYLILESKCHDQVNLGWRERNSYCNDEGRHVNVDGCVLYEYREI